MSRAFSTASKRLAKWLGYKKEDLAAPFGDAVIHYSQNGAIKVYFLSSDVMLR